MVSDHAELCGCGLHSLSVDGGGPYGVGLSESFTVGHGVTNSDGRGDADGYSLAGAFSTDRVREYGSAGTDGASSHGFAKSNSDGGTEPYGDGFTESYTVGGGHNIHQYGDCCRSGRCGQFGRRTIWVSRLSALVGCGPAGRSFGLGVA